MKSASQCLWLLVLLLPACNSIPESRSGAGVPMAIDWVCKYNGDLGCVDVPITPETPSTVYKGNTYYFCSKDCKAAFEAEPEKYLPRQK